MNAKERGESKAGLNSQNTVSRGILRLNKALRQQRYPFIVLKLPLPLLSGIAYPVASKPYSGQHESGKHVYGIRKIYLHIS